MKGISVDLGWILDGFWMGEGTLGAACSWAGLAEGGRVILL